MWHNNFFCAAFIPDKRHFFRWSMEYLSSITAAKKMLICSFRLKVADFPGHLGYWIMLDDSISRILPSIILSVFFNKKTDYSSIICSTRRISSYVTSLGQSSLMAEEFLSNPILWMTSSMACRFSSGTSTLMGMAPDFT